MTRKSFYTEDAHAELERLERERGDALASLTDEALRPLFGCYGPGAAFEWARFQRNRQRGNAFPGPRRLDLLRAIDSRGSLEF